MKPPLRRREGVSRLQMPRERPVGARSCDAGEKVVLEHPS